MTSSQNGFLLDPQSILCHCFLTLAVIKIFIVATASILHVAVHKTPTISVLLLSHIPSLSLPQHLSKPFHHFCHDSHWVTNILVSCCNQPYYLSCSSSTQSLSSIQNTPSPQAGHSPHTFAPLTATAVLHIF